MSNHSHDATSENIEHLIQTLSSDDLNTCMSAARSLGKFGQIAIIPLIKSLRSAKSGFGSIQALALIGEPAVAPLIQSLRDHSIDAFAAEALRKIGNIAVPALIDTLNDKDDNLRFWAAGILGWIGDQQAVEPLKCILNDENADVRKSAARALSELGIQT